jgi:FAD/FMN-containing dehydrogenase
MMPTEWVNWSGSLRFTPAQITRPADEAELIALVRRAAEAGRTIRPVGSGHSATGLLATDDLLVTFEHFQGIVATDQDRCQATVRAGTTLEVLGRDLARVGLDFPNLGDVATQTIAGVIATGTHGSGRGLHNLACLLVGGRLVTGRGEVIEFGEDDTEVLRAAASVSAPSGSCPRSDCSSCRPTPSSGVSTAQRWTPPGRISTS